MSESFEEQDVGFRVRVGPPPTGRRRRRRRSERVQVRALHRDHLRTARAGGVPLQQLLVCAEEAVPPAQGSRRAPQQPQGSRSVSSACPGCRAAPS